MNAGLRIEGAVERLVDDDVLIAPRRERPLSDLGGLHGSATAHSRCEAENQQRDRRRPPAQGAVAVQRVVPAVSKLSKKRPVHCGTRKAPIRVAQAFAELAV